MARALLIHEEQFFGVDARNGNRLCLVHRRIHTPPLPCPGCTYPPGGRRAAVAKPKPRTYFKEQPKPKPARRRRAGPQTRRVQGPSRRWSEADYQRIDTLRSEGVRWPDIGEKFNCNWKTICGSYSRWVAQRNG